MRAPIGIRVSSRRKALGISQAALARAVGISPSYLNLIEANKRQVGGSLLQRIAAELSVDIGALNGDTEHRLIHELQEAFADPILEGSGLGSDAARDLVAENPKIAGVIARLFRAYGAALSNADTYADRLRADPLLSQLLHQVLSGITAVRAGTEILEDVPDLSDDERNRFLSTIGREARGLTDVAQNLIGQFDRASRVARSVTPRRELDDLIFSAENYFPALEDAGQALRAELDRMGPFGEATLVEGLRLQFGITVDSAGSPHAAAALPRSFGYDRDNRTLWFQNNAPQATRRFQMTRLFCEMANPDVVAQVVDTPMLASALAKRMATRALSSYLAGAVVFPYERFAADARALKFDIEALSERYNASFEQIAHRLVTLRRPGDQGVPFGFLRSDPAGRLTKHFPLPGLLLPNTGHACPLWTIYAAFRSPGQITRQVVRFSDGSRYLFVAKAIGRRAFGFADQAPPYSVMLACDVLHADQTVYASGLDLSDGDADVPVGPSCRLCTRRNCPSRQEEPFVPDIETGSQHTALAQPDQIALL
jgi:XRE family transcriptional regulator, fatty acid utilization regulator